MAYFFPPFIDRYIKDRNVETLMSAQHLWQAATPPKDVLSAFPTGSSPQIRNQLKRLVNKNLENHSTTSSRSAELD